MKIKLGNWKIDTRTLIRVEKRKYFPKLIVHEKYENHVKWFLRIIGIIGIATSFLILPYEIGILLTILITLLEQFLEKTLFEYTIMILQPFPDFKIDYSEWLTNGYVMYRENEDENLEKLNYFGPVYKTREYAEKFFNYIRSWNQDSDSDLENNICISFIIEPDTKYSTYLYANPHRKWIQPMFEDYEQKMKLEKYGKDQQSMLMQMIFWNKLRMKEGMLFTEFIEIQKNRDQFYFAPFYIDGDNLVLLKELRVLKNTFKFKGRSELTENDSEFHLR
ncbi:hypothetical protein [Christiangramia aquimixticola]|uniref:hypothetical protein n=1 Tax=Christiangramia aquimixticola TaxID=1697558 RepID=UPI003AA86A8A